MKSQRKNFSCFETLQPNWDGFSDMKDVLSTLWHSVALLNILWRGKKPFINIFSVYSGTSRAAGSPRRERTNRRGSPWTKGERLHVQYVHRLDPVFTWPSDLRWRPNWTPDRDRKLTWRLRRYTKPVGSVRWRFVTSWCCGRLNLTGGDKDFSAQSWRLRDRMCVTFPCAIYVIECQNN